MSLIKIFLGFNTFGRIKLYVESIEQAYNPSKEHIKLAEPLKKQMQAVQIKATISSSIRNFFYFILYASVITAFFTAIASQWDLTFLNQSIKVVSSIIGGTAVAVVLAFIFDRMRNLYYIDMLLLASTITSIYASTDVSKINIQKIIGENSVFASKRRRRRGERSK